MEEEEEQGREADVDKDDGATLEISIDGMDQAKFRKPKFRLTRREQQQEEEEEEEEEDDLRYELDSEGRWRMKEDEEGIITVSEDEEGPELGTAIAEEPGTAVAEEPGTAVIVIEEGPAVIVIEEEPTSVGWFDPASRRWRRWRRGSLAPVTVTNPEA